MSRIACREEIVDAETLVHLVLPIESRTIQSIGKFAILWNYLEDQIGSSYKTVSQKIDNSLLYGHEEEIERQINRLKNYLSCKEGGYSLDSVKDCFAISFEDKKKKGKTIFADIEENDYHTIFNSKIPDDKLRLLFLVTKRIRNNMFHGINGKQKLDRLDDQRDLFEIGYETISIIVRLKESSGNRIRFV